MQIQMLQKCKRKKKDKDHFDFVSLGLLIEYGLDLFQYIEVTMYIENQRENSSALFKIF